MWLSLVRCTRLQLVLFGILSGCSLATPRSVLTGQGGAVLGSGMAEASLSGGVAYRSEAAVSGQGNAGSSSSTNDALTIPAFEANVRYGLSDRFDLNLHASPAGLQPGLKIGALVGPVSIAVMPEFAVGYMATSQNNPNSAASTASLKVTSLLVGIKVLASHSSGFFGALGYDYQRDWVTEQVQLTGSSGSQPADSHVEAHDVTLSAGFSLPVRGIEIRPELAVLWCPAQTFAAASPSTPSTGTSGSMWLLFPSVTVAARTSR